jgi:predicted NUDIX family phosphoesterase|tara:strand:- start:977 stop:1606 length:630 start_codon:yes stop_codon:yes gene_type:complete
MYEDESVLVIKRELFDEIGTFQGISTEIDKYLPVFLNPSNNFFIHRELAEDDPTHKQIIPYAIFKHGDKFLRYLRGKKSGEQRLASKSSIGIGGHINQDDFNSSSLEKDTYLTGIEREINEELIINCDYNNLPIALINDDSNDVGQVHLGVVHLFDLESDQVEAGEANIENLEFLSSDDLLREKDNLESWSQICVDHLDEIIKLNESKN